MVIDFLGAFLGAVLGGLFVRHAVLHQTASADGYQNISAQDYMRDMIVEVNKTDPEKATRLLNMWNTEFPGHPIE